MRKIIFILSLMLILISSCVTFESVIKTGQLAQKTLEYTTIFDESVDISNFVEANPLVRSTTSISSDTILKKNKVFKYALILIDAYGKELENISQKTDFKISDQIDKVIKSGKDLKAFELSDNEAKGLKLIADNLLQIVTNGIKRATIRDVVVKSDNSIQGVVEKLTKVLELKKESHIAVLNDLELIWSSKSKNNLYFDKRHVINNNNINNKDSLLVSYNTLDRFMIVYLRKVMNEEIKRIESCKTILKNFSVAHHVLFKEVKNIGTNEDSKVVQEILNSIHNILSGLNDLKPEKTKNNN